MKKFILGLSLVLLTVFSLVGCRENSPEGVIIKLVNAVSERDTEAAKLVMTDHAFKVAEESIAKGDIAHLMRLIPHFKQDQFTSGAEDTVFVNISLTFCTKKIEGEWKVCTWKPGNDELAGLPENP